MTQCLKSLPINKDISDNYLHQTFILTLVLSKIFQPSRPLQKNHFDIHLPRFQKKLSLNSPLLNGSVDKCVSLQCCVAFCWLVWQDKALPSRPAECLWLKRRQPKPSACHIHLSWQSIRHQQAITQHSERRMTERRGMGDDVMGEGGGGGGWEIEGWAGERWGCREGQREERVREREKVSGQMPSRCWPVFSLLNVNQSVDIVLHTWERLQ